MCMLEDEKIFLMCRDIKFRKVFSNPYRVKIFKMCSEPQTFSKLKNKIKLSTGALFRHLEILENNKAILKERAGQEVILIQNKPLISRLKNISGGRDEM